MTAFVRQVLREAAENATSHVFTVNGKPVSRTLKLSKYWEHAFDGLKLDKLPRVYDLRHAGCTGMYESKVQDVIVRSVMGHAARSMSEARYTHLSIAFQKGELERWSRRVFEAWNKHA